MEVYTGSWATNACVYATEAEAIEAGRALRSRCLLLSRWFVPTDFRAVEYTGPDPVNYKFDFAQYKNVKI